MPFFLKIVAFATLALNLHGQQITNGLLSYWPFDGGSLSDRAHQISGSASQVDDQGSWVGGNGSATGYIGDGIVLDGTQWVSVPDSSDLDRTASDVSIAAWFRVDNWTTSWQMLLSKGEGTAMRILRSSSSNSELGYAGGASNANYIKGGSVNDGAWHHVVAITRHLNKTELWIDGVKVDENTAPPSLSNNASSPFLIGDNPETSLRAWIGGIDEVAIWDRPLTESEIGYLANGGSPQGGSTYLDIPEGYKLLGVEFGSPTIQRSIPVTNTGDDAIAITSVSLGGANSSSFTVISHPTTLASGATGDVILEITPTTIDTLEAAITVNSSAEINPVATANFSIQLLPALEQGVSFRVFQADRELTAMPFLGSDQSPNVDEPRPTINYKDADKDGVPDAGADGNFGTIGPLLDRLEHIYCQAIGYLLIENEGNYEFRLTADDGAEMTLDGDLVINNTDSVRSAPLAVTSSSIFLNANYHPFQIDYWSGAGEPCLKLEWKRPGTSTWEVVPSYVAGSVTDGFLTEDATRVVSEGDKRVFYPGELTGELSQVHPSYELLTFAGDYDQAYPGENRPNPQDIIIDGTAEPWRPQSGGIAFLPDGTMIQTNFQPISASYPEDGAGFHNVYAISGLLTGDINNVTVKEVFSGLVTPTGICVVGNDVYIADMHRIRKLTDLNGDGDYFDSGENTDLVANDAGWEVSNYHHYTFGLLHQNGYLYGTTSATIEFGVIGLNGKAPKGRSNWFRASLADGTVEYLAGGLRTPNGLGFGPEGKMFGTDNQGSWNPANSFYEFTEGHFYGHYNLWKQEDGLGDPYNLPTDFWDSSVYWDPGETPEYANMYQDGRRRFTRPAVYFPQGEIARSPTTPLLIGDQHPSFKGQMFVGEQTMGGIRRVFLEKVNGRFQGAVFRFSQGFAAGCHRLIWGPDDAMYIGGLGPGGSSNWGWRGTKYAMHRLKHNNAPDAFEIRTLRAVEDGFILTMTQPVDHFVLSDLSSYESNVRHFRYDGQSYNYGSGKTELGNLTITSATPLGDGHSVKLTIPNMQEETVLHFKLTDNMVSSSGDQLWSGEAFYTLNAIPDDFEDAWASWVTENFSGIADLDVIGMFADPDKDGSANLSEFISYSDPKDSNSSGIFSIVNSGNTIQFKMRERDNLPTEINVGWEISTDLETWVPTNVVTLTSSVSNGDGSSAKTYSTAFPENVPRLFYRRYSSVD